MSAFAQPIPAELSGLLRSMDLAAVRADQAWVLESMRRDGPALVRLFWRLLGREQDVLDAYQDTYCKLLARAQQGMTARDGENGVDEPPREYVFRTAMNVGLDVRRRRKVRATHQTEAAVVRTRQAEASAAGGATGPEVVEALRAAIDCLPERLREVIVLRDLAEMSYREVARILNLTEGTARVYRRQAIVALAERLEQHRG